MALLYLYIFIGVLALAGIIWNLIDMKHESEQL